MSNTEKYDEAVGCESNSELNGEGASFRSVGMISEPAIIIKRRIKGALVPMPKVQK